MCSQKLINIWTPNEADKMPNFINSCLQTIIRD